MKLGFSSMLNIVLAILLCVTSYMLFTQPAHNETRSSKAPQLLSVSEQATLEKNHEIYVDDQQIIAALDDKLEFTVSAISPSPVPGLKQLYTDKGLFYVSNNGEYFLQARVYNIKGEVEDETENALKAVRKQGIERFKDSSIEFSAENEEFVINVFTDATCGYCRKLHNEIKQFNDQGITVRYLAWPRAGLNSKVYADTVSIWCAEDPQAAMTDAKAGKKVSDAECANQVAEQFKFGQQIGVNGTPNIVLPDGSVIPGYQPANIVAQRLREAT